MEWPRDRPRIAPVEKITAGDLAGEIAEALVEPDEPLADRLYFAVDEVFERFAADVSQEHELREARAHDTMTTSWHYGLKRAHKPIVSRQLGNAANAALAARQRPRDGS